MLYYIISVCIVKDTVKPTFVGMFVENDLSSDIAKYLTFCASTSTIFTLSFMRKEYVKYYCSICAKCVHCSRIVYTDPSVNTFISRNNVS